MERHPVDVRPCRADDLPLLQRSVPSQHHDERFERHEAGTATFLIAWSHEVPVGYLLLKWNGSEERRVKERFGRIPELNAITVLPELRSRGIGKQLIRAAETRIRARGLRRAGLAVAIDNHRAKALYERLGYQDWGDGEFTGSWLEVDERGERVRVSEQETYLTKELA